VDFILKIIINHLLNTYFSFLSRFCMFRLVCGGYELILFILVLLMYEFLPFFGIIDHFVYIIEGLVVDNIAV
jgi:hypothetical protein